MSVVRNVETDGGAFLSVANRLMRQLLDFADMGFPNDDEAVFATPATVMMAVSSQQREREISGGGNREKRERGGER